MVRQPSNSTRSENFPNYAAVIRAYEYNDLLQSVVNKLRMQSAPPRLIIVVDSSRNQTENQNFSSLVDLVVKYPDEEFNFSKAINIGVSAHSFPQTLVLSSHVILDDPDMILNGWKAAILHGCELVFWTTPVTHDEAVLKIDCRSFNGRNGISNSCALYPTSVVADRPFREEVFSAEDQEFTKYYIRTFRRPIVRIETPALRYLNPNHGSSSWSELKLLNEELAIGHFVNRRLIMPDRILLRILRGMLARIRGRSDRASLHFGVAKAYFLANFSVPKRSSRYFKTDRE